MGASSAELKLVLDVLNDVDPDELGTWSNGHRKASKPSKADIESYARRDAKIVEVATISHC
jgi:hypothetical protein